VHSGFYPSCSSVIFDPSSYYNSSNFKIKIYALKAPYKIPVPLWLAMLLQKLQSDDLTRATSTEVLKTLTRKNAGKLLISKLTRETY